MQQQQEEEDEELLLLRLQEVRTKIKIRQNRINKSSGEIDPDEDDELLSLKLNETQILIAIKRRQSASPCQKSDNSPTITREQRHNHSSYELPRTPPRSSPNGVGGVQVCGTPPKPRTPQQPVSPARIRLGIDKGLRASDVKLGRPPTATKKTSTTKQPKLEKSFAEKLSEASAKQASRKERTAELQRQRISGFTIKPDEKALHEDKPSEPQANVPSIYECYSKLFMSKRYIEKDDLRKEFDEMKLFSIPELYQTVSGPGYEPPDYPNWVVFGIVASKTEPKPVKGQESKRKFIAVTLTDLETDMSLYIIGKAFEKYWKLRVGDLVAVLNPGIYKNSMANNFAINVTDDNDVILEIGYSRDLGFCKSITSKGTQCTAWLNKKKAEYCEYHLDMGIRKGARGRMDINSSGAGALRLFDGTGGQKLSQKNRRPNTTRHGSFFDPEGGISRVFNVARSSNFDDSLTLRNHTGDRAKRKAAQRLKEQEIRRKLRKCPGGECFKGIDSDEDESDSHRPDTGGEESRIFSAEIIRRIGFDPSKRDKSKDTNTCADIIEGTASSVKLSRPTRQAPALTNLANDDDDDDLDIVM